MTPCSVSPQDTGPKHREGSGKAEVWPLTLRTYSIVIPQAGDWRPRGRF